MKTYDAKLQIYTTAEKHKALKRLALEADVSLTEIVGLALDDFMKKYKLDNVAKLTEAVKAWKESDVEK